VIKVKIEKANEFIKERNLTEFAIDRIGNLAWQSADMVSNYCYHPAIAAHFLRDKYKPKLEMNEDGGILATDVNVIRVFNWLIESGCQAEDEGIKPLGHFSLIIAACSDGNEFADKCAVGLIQLFDSIGFSKFSLKRFRRVIKACFDEWRSDRGCLMDYMHPVLEKIGDDRTMFNFTEEDESDGVMAG
jgi:hypothetical protein